MSKASHFKYQKLVKEFNKAMKDGNVNKAKQINDEIKILES